MHHSVVRCQTFDQRVVEVVAAAQPQEPRLDGTPLDTYDIAIVKLTLHAAVHGEHTVHLALYPHLDYSFSIQHEGPFQAEMRCRRDEDDVLEPGGESGRPLHMRTRSNPLASPR